ALAAAHAHGIVHRDVKPANIIIDPQGIPHLMDFGLARELFDEDPGVTAPGMLVGTAYYVAPEQARYGSASPAADLYSLGAVLYHALAGEPPFVGEGAMDVALRRFEEDPEDLRARVPAVDTDLATLVHTLLSRDTVERPWDAAAVAERLGDIGARLALEALVEHPGLIAAALEDLDRDGAVEHGVVRGEDGRGAAVPEDVIDSIPPPKQSVRAHQRALYPEPSRPPHTHAHEADPSRTRVMPRSSAREARR
ncbi:MAG TPA: serine/threonine-protein kinase, partial [Polyangiaceae bacterium]